MLVIVNQKKRDKGEEGSEGRGREKERHRDREEMLIKLKTVPTWS